MDSIPQKQCNKCKDYFPPTIEYFHRNGNKLRNSCKQCINSQVKQIRNNNPDYAKNWYADKEKRKQYETDWRERNKEYLSECKKQYNNQNREYIAQKKHSEYILDRDRKLIKVAIYRKENPEKRRIQRHKRITRQRELPFSFTKDDWNNCLEYFNHCCAVCEKPLIGLFHTVALDHWIPLNDPKCPGTVPGNVVPLCHAKKGGQDCCNNLKHDFEPVTWLKKMYGKGKATKINNRIQKYFELVKYKNG